MADATRYTGMTVVERLFHAGLMEAFDTAVRARNRAKLLHLLRLVDIEDARASVDMILKDPERYGW
ncbi:hypothetical protein [Erythrobacter mangrovi]|uniref:Uncharacterized protein n=1 Tax=Erythrobacter mangrovi TaxID=2739433 RepID=A0A7D4C410_9SPHN|nr:hypothetical protein [Erythrobacter mangrovi]QKG71205.1 hypothetical protein HQR01_07350 [Erythrobacter mangrovi]